MRSLYILQVQYEYVFPECLTFQCPVYINRVLIVTMSTLESSNTYILTKIYSFFTASAINLILLIIIIYRFYIENKNSDEHLHYIQIIAICYILTMMLTLDVNGIQACLYRNDEWLHDDISIF